MNSMYKFDLEGRPFPDGAEMVLSLPHGCVKGDNVDVSECCKAVGVDSLVTLVQFTGALPRITFRAHRIGIDDHYKAEVFLPHPWAKKFKCNRPIEFISVRGWIAGAVYCLLTKIHGFSLVTKL